MSANFVEELVAEYYRIQGYFAQLNYWIPVSFERKRSQHGKVQTYTAQSWTDIDVLAINKSELHIVQVKAIINERKVAEKIVNYFKQVDSYLDKGLAPNGSSSIDWWLNDRKVKRIVIYEYYSVPSYLDILRRNNIEVIDFKVIFDYINSYLDSKKGVKEENPLLRMLHFLQYNNYFHR